MTLEEIRWSRDQRSGRCLFGMTSVCPSAAGFRGKKASVESDSQTTLAFSSPRMIRQKSQS